MSGSTENDTLCERCSLLSFDDFALGGQEVVGFSRLYFPEARIETRPDNWPKLAGTPPIQLVRLDWKVEDSLPDMPQLSRSCQLGCLFCQALLGSLEEALAEGAKDDIIYEGALVSVAYLSLVGEGIEGLLVETTSTTFFQNPLDPRRILSRSLFPIEADSSKSRYPAEV
jgi:hypothetical protein